MNIKTQKTNALTHVWQRLIFAVAVGILLFGGVLLTLPNQAAALTRMQDCQSRQSQEAIQTCIDALDVETWNVCIQRPEAERGTCASEYKNGESNTTAPTTLDGPAVTNEDREKIANCDGTTTDCLADNPIMAWVLTLINFLAAGTGLVITIGIIVGGIQYATAGANPQAVSQAKRRITNAIIALIAFVFLYAFMQWLVPGGVF